MTTPDVSVIIPAHERPAELRSTLISLTRQTLSPDRFEIVVVDDASREDVFARSGDVLARMPHVTTYRNAVGLGAAGARNVGARASTGRILVFLDVDCLAHAELLEQHLAAQSERPLAICGYTHGRELTPGAWSLLLGEPWDMERTEDTFERAAKTPVLHDPLTELLSEPEPGDWAFFWTHNVSVRRETFEAVGGFSEEFAIKGCEDLELGLRLDQAGAPTVFLPKARALHQPHDRDRHGDLLRDRRHDLKLLMRHPRPDVEAVCSFDIVNARRLGAELTGFADRLHSASADCAWLTALPRMTRDLRTAGRVLLLGSADGWPADVPPPEVTVLPSARRDQGHLPLLGTRLPFEQGHFDLALITDYWRLLPERTRCRVIEEALRCSRRVIVLSDVATAPATGPDPALAGALDTYDHPFWEFAVGVAREVHQFDLEEFDRQERRGGHGRALTVRRLDWPPALLGELSTAVATP